jgi:pimeloyl-ACP methyl ester carboxylesterase
MAKAASDSLKLRRLLGDIPSTRFAIAGSTPLATGRPDMRATRLDLLTGRSRPVRAFLTGPDGPWLQRPAIIYCHAHGGRYDIGADELISGRSALQMPPYGEALAQIGIVALCIDLPCFGERAGERESALSKALLWQGKTLFGAMLADLTGAIGLLQATDGVDPNRIGAMGLSMGATLAFWLGALDPRIKAVAHLCCCADLATLVAVGAHELHGHYMTVPGLLSAYRTGQIAGLVAPRPQLACVGLLDPLTPELAVRRAFDDMRAAYQAANAPEALVAVIDPASGHVETPEMRAAVLSFLDRGLGR